MQFFNIHFIIKRIFMFETTSIRRKYSTQFGSQFRKNNKERTNNSISISKKDQFKPNYNHIHKHQFPINNQSIKDNDMDQFKYYSTQLKNTNYQRSNILKEQNAINSINLLSTNTGKEDQLLLRLQINEQKHKIRENNNKRPFTGVNIYDNHKNNKDLIQTQINYYVMKQIAKKKENIDLYQQKAQTKQRGKSKGYQANIKLRQTQPYQRNYQAKLSRHEHQYNTNRTYNQDKTHAKRNQTLKEQIARQKQQKKEQKKIRISKPQKQQYKHIRNQPIKQENSILQTESNKVIFQVKQVNEQKKKQEIKKSEGQFNEATFRKMQTINQLNNKINERIKYILDTFHTKDG